MNLARDRFSIGAFVESLILRRPASHQVLACFQHHSNAFASFGVRNGQEHVRGWLVETDAPISQRVPFDEAPALAAVVKGTGVACFAKPLQGYTPFEQLVVLMKALAAQVVPQEWWVSQVNLSSPLQAGRLEVKLRQHILGCFLTGDIIQDGKFIGSARGVLKSR
jgi:hypothetical protein